MTHEAVVGELMEVPCGEHSEYFFITGERDEDYIKLKHTGNLKGVPLNTKIALCMTMVGDMGVPCIHDKFYQELT